MSIKTVLGLTVVGACCLSCQSNSYQIDGYARDFMDGDTIYLRQETDGEGTVFITTVDDGKFSFAGEADANMLCHLYTKKLPATSNLNPQPSVSLFLEPGRITVELSLTPERNRVSGTPLNNRWQQLNDSVWLLGREVVRTSLLPMADSATQVMRARTIDSLHRRMSDCILNTARRNRDNPIGQYIEKNYQAPEFK